MPLKNCKECGEPFEQTRKDQEFCPETKDKHCRPNWHSKRKRKLKRCGPCKFIGSCPPRAHQGSEVCFDVRKKELKRSVDTKRRQSVDKTPPDGPEIAGGAISVDKPETNWHDLRFFFIVNGQIELDEHWFLKNDGKYHCFGFHVATGTPKGSIKLSVGKTKRNKIEVRITTKANIPAPPEGLVVLYELLMTIKAALQQQYELELSEPKPYVTRTGERDGQAFIGDISIPNPAGEWYARNYPKTLPYKPQGRPADKDAAEIDSSPITGNFEIKNNPKAASNLLTFLEDVVGSLDGLTDQEKINTVLRSGVNIEEMSNNIKAAKEQLSDLKESERRINLSDRNTKSAIYRAIKEGDAKHDIELTQVGQQARMARYGVEDLDKNLTIITQNLAQVAESMAEFGEHTKSHVGVMKGGDKLARTLLKVAKTIEEQQKKMEGVNKAMEFRQAAGEL